MLFDLLYFGLLALDAQLFLFFHFLSRLRLRAQHLFHEYLRFGVEDRGVVQNFEVLVVLSDISDQVSSFRHFLVGELESLQFYKVILPSHNEIFQKTSAHLWISMRRNNLSEGRGVVRIGLYFI